MFINRFIFFSILVVKARLNIHSTYNCVDINNTTNTVAVTYMYIHVQCLFFIIHIKLQLGAADCQLINTLVEITHM